MRRGTLRATIVVVTVLFGVAVGGGIAAAGETTTAQRNGTLAANDTGAIGTTPAQTNTLTITQEYRLTPTQPGKVDIQWQFSIPDNVGEISGIQFPSGATNPRKSGFEKADSGYVWTEDEQSTRTPTLTYTASVNVTDDVSGPIGSDGRFLFVDTGDWALIQRQPGPEFSFSRRAGTSVVVERTNTTAGEGVAGQAMIFMGPYESYERTAHDQRFRLVVPEAADLAASRDDVFATVMNASKRLRVGDRDGQVLMFVAPTSVPWGVRGLQVGDRDLYAVADEPVDTADNVWIHEYVHTRQDYRRTDPTAWTIEAFAEYYASLLTLEQGRIGFDEFRSNLERGTRSRFDDVVLADRSSWEGTGGNYFTGSLVAGAIDRRIRLASDRERSLQTVWRQLNGQSTAVTQSEFLRYVGSAGSSTVRSRTKQYTESTDRPSLWSKTSHSEAFEPLPPEFRYQFPASGSDGLRVSGPYRNRTLSSGALVPGETLAIDVNVTNVGGSEGTYDLTVTRNGATIDTRSGSALAGESVTETVKTTFESTGTYTLSTGEATYTVSVRQPAAPTVSDLSVNRTQVRPDGTVRVTATVANSASKPANGTVAIQRGGTVLTERQVRLDAGGSTTVTATATLSALGDVTFEAGERSASVTVTGSTATATDGGDSGSGGIGATGPGFSVGLAVLAVLGSLLLAGRRE